MSVDQTNERVGVAYEPSARCPKCGEELQEAWRIHLRVQWCLHCDYRNETLATPAGLFSDIRTVRLRIEWHGGHITYKQAIAARKIAAALADKSLPEVMSECGKSKVYDLGKFLEPTADELVAKARQLGLKVVSEPIPD